MVDAVRSFDARGLATYPDYRAAVVETAAFLGVDPDRLVLTNGLDEGVLLAAIGYLGHRTPPALVEAGAPMVSPSGQPEVIVAAPAFETYVTTAKALGARVVQVPPGPDFAFPTDGIVRAMTSNTRIVYVNNPNNPTGQPVAQAAIRRIAGEAGHALVFVDEAYHDFMGENFLEAAAEFPNVIVGRTFSKAHGLAGMRVGRDDRVAGGPRADSLRDAALQPQRRRGRGAAGGARRSELYAVVSGAGRRVEGAALRRARARRPPLLEERGQLRAR